MANTDTQTADRLDTTNVPLAGNTGDTKLARIEDRLDHDAAGDMLVSAEVGGVQFRSMLEVMEFAKLMSLGGVAVPPHCRGNPGTCLAICVQALEWKCSPFAVANKSYVVNNKGVERIAYESQLIHAVIEARAPLEGRLKARYEGDGDDRVCIVYATFRGDVEPTEYRSPTLGKRRPGVNESGALKGSPLWRSKPDLQQFYDASRDFARMYCPDVLLGLYTVDEMQEVEELPAPPSPNLLERLPGHMEEGTGFQTDVVDQGLAVPTKAKAKAKAAARKGPAKRSPPASAKKKGRQTKPQRQGSPKPTGKAPTPRPKPKAAQAASAGPAREAPKATAAPAPATAKAPPGIPTNAAEYVAQARIWIAQATSVVEAGQRWEAERELRERLQVPIATRTELQAAIRAVGQ